MFARHFDEGLSIEHNLVLHRALARQSGTAPLWREFNHLDANRYGITDPDRRAEVQGLRNVDSPGPGKRVPRTAEIRLAV